MTTIEIGKIYGSLTVISQSPEQKRSRQCECLCLCGNKVIMYTYNLTRFKHKTCFCAQREKIRKRRYGISTFRGVTHKSHGEYEIWKSMRKRCFNKNCNNYKDYGGRGIKISPTWNDFKAFLSDMGPRPSINHSIDRIDNNGDYCKSNCKWATSFEQGSNTRRNHYLTFDGETHHLSGWARKVGLTEDCLERRLNLLKWPIEKALTTQYRGWGPGKPRPQP